MKKENKKIEKFADTDEVIGISYVFYYIISIFILIWVLLGIAAWIMSIYCFKSGVNPDSVMGAVIAFIPPFLGPLYWIYYIWNPNYCRKNITINTN